MFTGKTPDYLLKKGDFPLLYNLPIHTILLTMSLKNTHYCDILLNMSQKNAHFNLISPTQKMPKGGMEAACYQFNSFCEVKTASLKTAWMRFLSTDLGNQAIIHITL